jgi:hypothetical protein
VRFNNTTQTVGTDSGALTVVGGIGIGGGVYVGGNLYAAGTVTATNTVRITNSDVSTSTTTGALVVTGGLGIGGNLVVGGLTILQQAQEVMVPINAPGPFAVLDFNKGAIFYITGMTSNFEARFVNVPTSANHVYATTLILVQSATTACVSNSVTVNSVSRTIRWSGGTTATVTTSRTDVISITLVATGTNAYTVLAGGSGYY